MEIKFKDFYGQKVEITDHTSSGNVRIKVTTTENLNDLHNLDVPRIETDISLDGHCLELLIKTLQYISNRQDEGRES